VRRRGAFDGGVAHPMKTLSLCGALLLAGAAAAFAQINTTQTVAPGVYFHEGDPRHGHSNNGWIVFDDFVLVVDANYPSGARIVMPHIAATTDRPVKFVFNTHHHADHAYGNQLWADRGATLVGSAAMLAEMKAVEPGRWNESAKKRPDVAATKLKFPVMLFPQDLWLDDGTHRVELRTFGTGHTKGDAYAWLPKEKILFTGDACVNGPHNNVNDGSIAEWIATLERVKHLGAEKVCPGHGPMGGPEIIADQQAYFIGLTAQVKALADEHRTPAEVKAALPEINAALKRQPNIARYVPANLTAHVQKVWSELGGGPLPR
jgi:glyoxylase-like metal-dependent hydrolase (beta-lactamase superfamily II)